MSADDAQPRDDLDLLVSARLDGDLGDEAWQQACASHGPALTSRYDMAQHLRQWCADDATPDVPPALLLSTMAAVGSHSPSRHNTLATPQTTSNALWSWVAAAAVAAGLGALLLPLAISLRDDPTSHAITTAITPGYDSAAPQQLHESGIQFAMVEEDSDDSAPLASLPKARRLPSPSPAQEPAMPSSPPAHANNDEPDEDAVIAALAAEAETYRSQQQEPATRPQPLPTAVLRDALAAEERAAEGSTEGDRLRLNLAMAIDPGEGDESPIAAISIVNRGTVDAPMRSGLLAIEGLDDAGGVVWTLTPTLPGGSLPPGEQWDWSVTISEDNLPPASVRHTRLRYGPVVSESSPWPQ